MDSNTDMIKKKVFVSLVASMVVKGLKRVGQGSIATKETAWHLYIPLMFVWVSSEFSDFLPKRRSMLVSCPPTMYVTVLP